MLGIVIGIGAFILINSVGTGAQGLVLNQIKDFGSDLVGILPGASDEKGPPASVFGINITTLKEADALAIERNVPNVIAAASYVRGSESITFGSESRSVTFYGVNEKYLQVENTEVESGRFFSDDDSAGAARVVVLGSTLAGELFGDVDPVGEQVKLDSGKYTVIGVMKARGTTAFQDYDGIFFIPLATAQKVVLGIRHLAFVRVKVNGVENLDQAVEDIKSVLRQQHRITNPDSDDFSVRNTQQALGVLTTVTDALRLFLTAIAAVSLLVGGIGIMNIMYVSVSERTYEIGLRKAVGANNADILWQFLVEAIIITIIAGIIGIIGGALLSYIAAVVVRALEYDWDFVISTGAIALACAISAGVGLIFGLYPARRAALMTPKEALTHE